MIALTVIKVGLEKNIAYIIQEKFSNNSKLEQFHKVIQQLSPVKVMALRLILTSSKNFDDMLDRICSPADVDHLIAERTAYVKSQKTKNLKNDIHNNDDSTNLQNNHVSYGMINTCPTQDSANYEAVDSDTC